MGWLLWAGGRWGVRRLWRRPGGAGEPGLQERPGEWKRESGSQGGAVSGEGWPHPLPPGEGGTASQGSVICLHVMLRINTASHRPSKCSGTEPQLQPPPPPDDF